MDRPGGSTAARAAGSALVAACVLLAVTTTTQSGWSQARIDNNAPNRAASGALAFSHTATATCSAGPSVAATTTCAGTVLPTGATSASGAVTGSDAITDSGTITAARLTQTVQAPSCAPVRLDDSQTAGDPMLPRYTPSFQQADRWGSTSALGLSGGAYAADVTTLNTSTLLGNSYTVGVWFKVASGYANGGGLISVAGSPATTSTAAGPVAVWLDNQGKVRFYVAGTLGTSSAGVSAASYNDGAWHLAVLSVTAAVASTPTLYVDGTSVTGLGITALTGNLVYWHLGWADLPGVAGAPATAALTGALSGGFVVGAALSATAVANLRATATAAAYQSALTGTTGIQHVWMLGDTGTTTYAGALPGAMAAPCGQVDIAFSFTGPAATIAKQSLASFANGVARSVAAPGPGATQTMTTSITRGTGWSSDIAGLRLRVPITVTETTSPSSSWSLAFTWPGVAGVVLA